MDAALGADGYNIVSGPVGQRDGPLINAIGAGHNTLGCAVQIKLHRVAVGINLGGDKVGQTIGERVAGNIDHWVGRPIGLVIIKSVLARLAVVCDQAFVITSVGRAFSACVRSEIKQVPNELGPKIGPGFDDRPVDFVNDVLPFFRVKVTVVGRRPGHRIFAVLIDACAGTIFTLAGGPFWITGMGTIHKRCQAV